MNNSLSLSQAFRLCILAFSAIFFLGGVCAAEEIAWEHSLDKALTRAQAEKKLIFLDIYADWCGPCQKMMKDTFPDPAVVKALSAYVPLKVNADKDRSTASRYGTGSLPTLAVLTAEGAAVQTEAGFRDAPRLLEFLKSAEGKLKRLSDLEKAVAAAPDDTAKGLELVDLYMQMRAADKAVGLIRRIKPAVDEKGTAQEKGDLSFNLGFALLLSDAFADGVAQLEDFAKTHSTHPRAESAKGLIDQGKLFDAMSRADRSDYAGARELLSSLAENAGDSRLAQYAKDRLEALKLFGKPAPALAVSEWVGGKKGDLAALKGKMVLLVFFQADNASWEDARGQVAELLATHQGAGLSGVGIAIPADASDEQSLAAIRTHVKETAIAYPVGVDRGERETFNAYGGGGTPWTVLLDSAGNIRYMDLFEKDAVEGVIKGLLMEVSG
jgi:thiol-disulfide isomerase/thioredoxin